MRPPPPIRELAVAADTGMSVQNQADASRGGDDDAVEAGTLVNERPRGGSIQAVEFALEILEYVARGQTSVEGR